MNILYPLLYAALELVKIVKNIIIFYCIEPVSIDNVKKY